LKAGSSLLDSGIWKEPKVLKLMPLSITFVKLFGLNGIFKL